MELLVLSTFRGLPRGGRGGCEQGSRQLPAQLQELRARGGQALTRLSQLILGFRRVDLAALHGVGLAAPFAGERLRDAQGIPREGLRARREPELPLGVRQVRLRATDGELEIPLARAAVRASLLQAGVG